MVISNYLEMLPFFSLTRTPNTVNANCIIFISYPLYWVDLYFTTTSASLRVWVSMHNDLGYTQDLSQLGIDWTMARILQVIGDGTFN